LSGRAPEDRARREPWFIEEPHSMNVSLKDTHSKVIGYVLWIFGFMGAHRFYYGKRLTGVLYFFTLGLLFIGWIVDLFLIPSMDREADLRFTEGPKDYNIAWLLLTFLGIFGIHRFYMGKWPTGILYLLTVGLFLVGLVYDFLTLNQQLSDVNSRGAAPV
jgi:TM2 domain-containing membrane protein YozV